MRIYKINIEHFHWGRNFLSLKVTAKTCIKAQEKALRMAKRQHETSHLRVESAELLAADDEG